MGSDQFPLLGCFPEGYREARKLPNRLGGLGTETSTRSSARTTTGLQALRCRIGRLSHQRVRGERTALRQEFWRHLLQHLCAGPPGVHHHRFHPPSLAAVLLRGLGGDRGGDVGAHFGKFAVGVDWTVRFGSKGLRIRPARSEFRGCRILSFCGQGPCRRGTLGHRSSRMALPHRACRGATVEAAGQDSPRTDRGRQAGVLQLLRRQAGQRVGRLLAVRAPRPLHQIPRTSALLPDDDVAGAG